MQVPNFVLGGTGRPVRFHRERMFMNEAVDVVLETYFNEREELLPRLTTAQAGTAQQFCHSEPTFVT